MNYFSVSKKFQGKTLIEDIFEDSKFAAISFKARSAIPKSEKAFEKCFLKLTLQRIKVLVNRIS